MVKKDLRIQNCANVMRATRKLYGLVQSDIMKIFPQHFDYCTNRQGTISKLESGVGEPRLLYWYDFCEHFKLCPDLSMKLGYVEPPLRKVRHKNTTKVGKFKIPTHFAKTQGLTIRSVLPFIQLANGSLGEKTVSKHIRTLGFDPDYFLVLNNPINDNFIYTFLSWLFDKGILSINNPSLPVCPPPHMHGSLLDEYMRCQNTSDLLAKYIKNADRYEVDCLYELLNKTKDEITFRVLKNHHVPNSKVDPRIEKWFWTYRVKLLDKLQTFNNNVAGKLSYEDTGKELVASIKF